jgi:hypothetical protein
MRNSSESISFLSILLLPALGQADFIAHDIASGLRFGYQVHIADLNRDGRPDVIGLGAQMNELLWFENPDWEPHVLAADVPQMISLDTADTDGDGIPEIALAYRFTVIPSRSPGQIAILSHNGDPTEPWTLRDIEAVPATHRVRWADIDGNGDPVLVAAPIVNGEAENQNDPEQLPTPLVYFRPGQWTRELVSDANRGTVHGLLPWDSDGDGADEVLTAGRMGVHAHRLEGDGAWAREALAAGVDAAYPDGGSSDLAAGQLAGRPFLAAIEPFHGNQVVVYRPAGDGEYSRLVIDTELQNGHTITVADFTGDGRGEIVAAGNRGRSVYLYRAADDAGDRWERTVIDDDISANSCATGDINGDGRTDVACIDMRQPNNVRWYENTGDW